MREVGWEIFWRDQIVVRQRLRIWEFICSYKLGIFYFLRSQGLDWLNTKEKYQSTMQQRLMILLEASVMILMSTLLNYKLKHEFISSWVFKGESYPWVCNSFIFWFKQKQQWKRETELMTLHWKFLRNCVNMPFATWVFVVVIDWEELSYVLCLVLNVHPVYIIILFMFFLSRVFLTENW